MVSRRRPAWVINPTASFLYDGLEPGVDVFVRAGGPIVGYRTARQAGCGTVSLSIREIAERIDK